jgi:hypothetical protein
VCRVYGRGWVADSLRWLGAQVSGCEQWLPLKTQVSGCEQWLPLKSGCEQWLPLKTQVSGCEQRLPLKSGCEQWLPLKTRALPVSRPAGFGPNSIAKGRAAEPPQDAAVIKIFIGYVQVG